MKIKLFTLIFLFSALAVFAQNYPHVSIHDLQFVPDDSLAINKDASLHVGDTVQVTGVVMASTLVDPTFNRKPIMWAGARWQTYLRDTNYTANEWAGINIIQNDTSLAAQGTLMDLLDTAQVVTITGVVAEFGQQTQINVLTNPVTPIQFIGSKPNRGEPVEVTIAELNNGQAANYVTGEKYEGMYVIIRNVITSDRTTSTSSSTPFAINDGLGNKIFIHDQSGYFTIRTGSNDHRLRNWTPPIDGTTIQYIRGVIGQFTNPSRFVIRPMYPDDLLIGQSPPSITNIKRDKGVVTPTDEVTVSATITDIDAGGSILQAKLFYRVNGGELNQVVMDEGSNNVWSATIPATNMDSALVSFYVWAKDNDDMTNTNPADTLKNLYFYLTLNRDLTVQDIEYSPFGGGFSGYNNYRVTVSGVVTADTTDLQGDGNQVSRRVYIQNGEGPWSGVWVGGLLADPLQRGQNITVSGLVRESNNNTMIDSITSIVINSSNNPLPAPQLVSVADIGTLANGTLSAEMWEGVLIKYVNVTVTNENADGQPGPNGGGNSNFGEILVKDAANVNSRVELQEGNHQYHNMWIAGLDTLPGNVRILAGAHFDELIGVLFYSFSNYKLVPRKADDFVGLTAVDNELQEVKDYYVSQNYPNPFNPVTTIAYSLPQSGVVSLKIYNILGQEVKSLVNMDQASGSYKVIFDASNLSSGVYLYQLNVNDYQVTKKMILMK